MKNKRGFTLVELILVMAVTTILLGTVITILLQSISLYKIDETKSANQDSINLVSSSIETKLRSVISVSVSGTDCVLTTASGDYVYALNTTTKILSVNGTTLTGGIASFSCTVTGDVVTVNITTINDSTGIPQSLNSSIVIRKGD